MKKVLLIVMLSLLSGCASAPSEYNQGCRDGVNGIGLEHGTKENINKYCDGLDSLHKNK